MIEPIFLTIASVLEIHIKQLDAHEGIHGLRSQSLFESAVMTPQASFGGEYLTRIFTKWRRHMLST